MSTMIRTLTLAIGLGLGLAGAAQAQPGSGSAPGTGGAQAPVPQANRPQSDPRAGTTPQPQAASLREYVDQLRAAQQKLETAINRSGDEPAANDQKAMTPAFMDLKSAAQAAYETVHRVPESSRDRLYNEAEARMRGHLSDINQTTEPEKGREAARKVLEDIQRFTGEMSRRASAASG
jgi:hypothetical protein